MKPRTKLQKRVAELSSKLPSLTEKQKRWAEEKCFEHLGYMITKGMVWCLECGSEFKAEMPTLAADLECYEMVCPVCGKKIKIKRCRKQQFSESMYFTILTTCNGFQVCRHFEIKKEMWRRGAERWPHFYINEVVQNWISEDGKETIIARPVITYGYYRMFSWLTPMSIKEPSGYYGEHDKYNINAYFTYPVRKILPILRKHGYTARFDKVAPNELMKRLLTDNMAETFIKTKRYDLLYYRCIRDNGMMNRYKASIRIAMRHGYKPKDTAMWLDYIAMCDEMKMDVRNPKYICPKNLNEAHDSVLDKLTRKRKNEDRKRAAEEAEKWEKEYKKEKGKYFGICFGDENLMITVIKSVAEMADEGHMMHHCVFACEYYKKPESLILSAKDKNGRRVETIEINLKTFDIVQSRGACNQSTEYHQEIINLVNNNMNLIRKAA